MLKIFKSIKIKTVSNLQLIQILNLNVLTSRKKTIIFLANLNIGEEACSDLVTNDQMGYRCLQKDRLLGELSKKLSAENRVLGPLELLLPLCVVGHG